MTLSKPLHIKRYEEMLQLCIFFLLSEHEYDYCTQLTYLTPENIKTKEKIDMGKRDVRDLKKNIQSFAKDHEI